jgi:hypothetical protein
MRKTPRQSGPAPKGKRERAQASTAPPPKAKKAAKDTRNSNVQTRKSTARGAGATVDEVVADLSKDPRRERD